MTATPVLNTQQKRFKGSLTSTLVRTLLIFSFIPLALMAVVGYFRARALLREQAVTQSQNLLTNQLKIIDREIINNEALIERQFADQNFRTLIELGLHANPQSSQFRQIRSDFVSEFQRLNTQQNTPVFDQYFLMDTKGNIRIASNTDWQDVKLDPSIFDREMEEYHSVAMYGLSPIYNEQFVLVTALKYKTASGSILGSIVGITEKENLQEIIQPLNGISTLASIYFILPDNQYIHSDETTGEFTLEAASSSSRTDLATALSKLISTNQSTPEALDIKSPDNENILAQLAWFPRMQTGVVLEVKASSIYGQISSLAPFTMLLVLGTLIATGLVLSIGVNRIIKPLRSLSDITHGFAEGDWSRRAEVLSDDEVGFLANSFNHMADELSGVYRSLEQKVDERTRQIRTAAEVAQNITTISNLDEMLDKTVELLVQQFEFYQASIFMVDRGGKYIEFKTGYGSATKGMADGRYRLEVGSASIIGWVSANNQPRIASDVLDDPLHLKNELLPETRSEATVPISIGNLVLGVLDVQSAVAGAFNSAETIVMLKTLASQISAAIQTMGLVETSQINFEELERLYRSSRLIANANSESEVLAISGQILEKAPYPVVLLRLHDDRTEHLEILLSSDSTRDSASFDGYPKHIGVDVEKIKEFLHRGPIITAPDKVDVPAAFQNLMEMLELVSAAILPVKKHDAVVAIIVIGTRKHPLSNAAIQPYTNLADLMSITLEKAEAVQQTERHLREVESLASINELISATSDIQNFYMALLDKIHQIIGKYSLIVALYDKNSNTISVPFSYENEQITAIESFPLGEGLTSLLIRTKQPLMLVEDTERRAAGLGAKLVGKPAQSWMGAPMLVHNDPIGALIIQDPDHEHAFDDADLKFFTTITSQVAGVINNIRLLDESQHRALQLETAAEIARDISGSLNLDELLIKAVNFILERLDFYHAAVFLRDLSGEFSMIREATGEAGAQMKRAGYKIGIGSKSIVGFVSGRGEQLVVNDTTKDSTYYANPLLPDTRAEAAIPLKVGERILGVLDIQSTRPYAFSEDNLRSLQILADQLAVAVVNTELFAETQEHLSQHRLLHHITTTAASGTTLEEALESAVNGLQVTLGGDRVTILLADREKKMLEVKASMGYAENVSTEKILIGSGITGWVAAHKRPLRVRNVSEDPRYIQLSPNTRSELAIPLIYRNELLGVLNVESEQPDAYTENDEEMLGTLGGSLAAIIANARLLEQIRLQAERERVIFEVTSKIRRSTDIQSILMTTASELTRITGARYAKIQVKPITDSTKKDRQ
ncbi:MAG: GAF domain-containing protein [Chloroflexi bacterium]|nr:GAF domain-containing protein [Chloroflexota bacterium]